MLEEFGMSAGTIRICFQDESQDFFADSFSANTALDDEQCLELRFYRLGHDEPDVMLRIPAPYRAKFVAYVMGAASILEHLGYCENDDEEEENETDGATA